MKGLLGALTLILFSQLVLGATISGNVYDFSLEQVEAIVEINTTPTQKIVVKDSYSFQVPLGNYRIIARQTGDDASTEEYIEILDQGNYVIDIILFPDVNVEEELEFEEPVEEFEFGNESSRLSLLALLGMLCVAALIYYVSRNSMPKGEHELDSEARKVLSFITKNKRTTQKEIRKEFPHSEAKISLIITELEDKGYIQKIKKGRGNVIIRK